MRHQRRTRPGRAFAAGAVAWSVCAGLAEAGETTSPGAADKSQYTLFNPTPERLLRELSTDRPDLTESPFTVDAGRVQFETSLFGYARSRPDSDGVVSDSYEFATTNIRIGLTNASELNIVWQPYGIVRTHPTDRPDGPRNAGIGALEIRSKINFWGNDNFEKPGSTGFGFLPYVSFPTDRGNSISPDAVEGGFLLPYAIKLTEKFELGLNAGTEAVRNEDTAGYHPEYLGSVSLTYKWTERLSTYYEVAGRFGTRDPRGEPVIVATGAAYQLSSNLQIDAGINIGVTDAADRINPFVGISARF